MPVKKNNNKDEKPIETTATENPTIENEDDLFDVYDEEINNNNSNNSDSKEETNMTQNNNNQNNNTEAQETKKGINWKSALKYGGAVLIGAGLGAAGMYFYEKNANDSTPAESAFI